MKVVPYTRVVPPGWEGFCCYCRRRLTVADWREQRVIAAGPAGSLQVLCLEHIGSDRPEYQDAVDALASAVARVL